MAAAYLSRLKYALFIIDTRYRISVRVQGCVVVLNNVHVRLIIFKPVPQRSR